MKKKPGKKMKWTSDKIKALREVVGESREDFAVRIAVSKFSLRNWEQGQFEPSIRVQKILDRVEQDLIEGRIMSAEKQPA